MQLERGEEEEEERGGTGQGTIGRFRMDLTRRDGRGNHVHSGE